MLIIIFCNVATACIVPSWSTVTSNVSPKAPAKAFCTAGSGAALFKFSTGIWYVPAFDKSIFNALTTFNDVSCNPKAIIKASVIFNYFFIFSSYKVSLC